jgi:hypothetical protein
VEIAVTVQLGRLEYQKQLGELVNLEVVALLKVE